MPLRHLIARIPGLRPFVRTVRQLRDGLLHPWRRRRALDAVMRAGPGGRIVVLCLGNINRSPFAAALLTRRLAAVAGQPPQVMSAGFIGPGRPSPPEAVTLAAARGLDITSHRSRLVTEEMVRDAGLVIVMSAKQARAVSREFGADARRVVILGDLDNRMPVTREIPDPYDQDPAVYAASFARIERCVEAVAIAVVGARSGSPGRPSGRGAA